MISGPGFYFQFNFHTILILTMTKGMSKVISRTIVSSWFLDFPLSQNQHLLVVLLTSDGAMLTVLGAASSWLSVLGSSEAWPSGNHVEPEAPLAGDPPGPGFPSTALYYFLLSDSQTVFDNDFDAKGRPQLRHEVEDASSNGFVVSCDSLGSNLFHKVSRAGVLWIMYIRQSVNSGPHRLSAATLRYEELMALSAMILPGGKSWNLSNN